MNDMLYSAMVDIVDLLKFGVSLGVDIVVFESLKIGVENQVTADPKSLSCTPFFSSVGCQERQRPRTCSCNGMIHDACN